MYKIITIPFRCFIPSAHLFTFSYTHERAEGNVWWMPKITYTYMKRTRTKFFGVPSIYRYIYWKKYSKNAIYYIDFFYNLKNQYRKIYTYRLNYYIISRQTFFSNSLKEFNTRENGKLRWKTYRMKTCHIENTNVYVSRRKRKKKFTTVLSFEIIKSKWNSLCAYFFLYLFQFIDLFVTNRYFRNDNKTAITKSASASSKCTDTFTVANKKQPTALINFPCNLST